MRGRHTAAAAVAGASLLSRPASASWCSADYYGGGDGISSRWGIEEHSNAAGTAVPGTDLQRLALFTETHERLRIWASEENWRKATHVHKTAFFPRGENLVQEAVMQDIRAHYVATKVTAPPPVQAALFRGDRSSFSNLCKSTAVAGSPTVVDGLYDQKAEKCIVDFANKRLGGAWLSYGMVQEEKVGWRPARNLRVLALTLRTPVAAPSPPTLT